MPTLTGIILAATGTAFSGKIRLQKMDAANVVSGSLQGGGIITSTAAKLTSPGVTLAAGVWLLTWWEGAVANSARLSIPAGSGTVTLGEVVTTGTFTTYEAVYANPDAVRAVTVGSTVQVLFLKEDEQEPNPNKHVWFIRDETAGDDDGVSAVHDFSGAKFVRASI